MIRHGSPARSGGYTLVELLVAMLIGALVLAGLGGVVSQALANRAYERASVAATRDAAFALERMVNAIGRTRRLLVPRADNPITVLYSEALRNPGVLAVTLDPEIDRDRDGTADADNDGDGRVDEDPSGDLTNDLASGVVGIDDDNDGQVDEAHGSAAPAADDDDEDGVANEDPFDGADDDGDGTVDEDASTDVSGDGEDGLIGVDDDGDTLVDEGNLNDDDEDGTVDEDWFDAVVYFLSGTQLIERMPDLNPADGTDYTERVIADGVTSFQIERLPPRPRGTLVEITIDIAGADGDVASLKTRVRVGGLL